MSASWLKLIGDSKGRPCPDPYKRDHVDFRRRKPRNIHPGDRMVLYAVGGSKCVFALAEVTSEPYDTGQVEWRWRVNVKYMANLPVTSGVPIDEVSTPERDLLLSIRQASYIDLSPKEYDQAATKLREAATKA